MASTDVAIEGMRRIFLALFLLLTPAFAALPPQSPEELAKGSQFIVKGEVLKIESQRKLLSNGYDFHYTLTLKVTEVDKGDLKGARQIEVFCRQTGKRFGGWAGPQGQDDIPDKGARGTFYLSWGKTGYRLLEPNGWVAQ